LKGIAVGSTFTDPYVQLNWGEHLYSHGLVDEEGKEFMDAELEEMRTYIDEGKWLQAFEVTT
jgi:hypothetical protein